MRKHIPVIVAIIMSAGIISALVWMVTYVHAESPELLAVAVVCANVAGFGMLGVMVKVVSRLEDWATRSNP